MRSCQSRPIEPEDGYARPRSVGALTMVWGQRSDWAGAVLVPAVVKTKILEGKQ
jgi:hypothetical protein